jgi:hypothetical protein
MKLLDPKEEIALLEKHLLYYQDLLDKSIESNEELAKSKALLHEIKKIKIRLEEIKNI